MYLSCYYSFTVLWFTFQDFQLCYKNPLLYKFQCSTGFKNVFHNKPSDGIVLLKLKWFWTWFHTNVWKFCEDCFSYIIIEFWNLPCLACPFCMIVYIHSLNFKTHPSLFPPFQITLRTQVLHPRLLLAAQYSGMPSIVRLGDVLYFVNTCICWIL